MNKFHHGFFKLPLCQFFHNIVLPFIIWKIRELILSGKDHSMKRFIIISILSVVSANVFSQTIKQNIDKQMKDKNTMDRSAKADVLIQKKTISDSTAIKKQTLKTGDKQEAPRKSHRRKYKRKLAPKSPKGDL